MTRTPATIYRDGIAWLAVYVAMDPNPITTELIAAIPAVALLASICGCDRDEVARDTLGAWERRIVDRAVTRYMVPSTGRENRNANR